MNSDFSQLPPDERAQRLTALILGELSVEEAEQICQALAADPDLAREHARLRQTIALVRETGAMDRKVSPSGTPLKLDDARRQKLLETFKQPAPRAVMPRRHWRKWFVPMSAAAVLIGLLVVVTALPMFVKARAGAERITRLGAFGGQEIVLHKLGAERPKLGLDLIALPSSSSSLEDDRRQISGQAQSSGFLAVNDPMFYLADAEPGVKTAVPGAAGSVALNYTTQGEAGGLAPRPATVPVTADGLRAPNLTTTREHQSLVRAQDRLVAVTDLDTDFTPAKASEFRELPNPGGGAIYAGVGIAPGSGGGGGGAGRGGGQNGLFAGGISGGAQAGAASSSSRTAAVSKPGGANASPAPGHELMANNHWDYAERFAVNGSDLGLAKLSDVTDDGAVLHVNGVAVKGNVIPSGQPEAKDVKRVAGDSSIWKSEDHTTGLAAGTKDGPINLSGAVDFFNKPTRADVVEERFGFEKGEPQASVEARGGFGNSLNSTVNRGAGVADGDAAANRPATVRQFNDDNFNVGSKVPSDKTLGDLNDRVAIQFPGLATEEQLGRQSSPTQPTPKLSLDRVGGGGARTVDTARLPGIPADAVVNGKLPEVSLQESEVQLEAQRRTITPPVPVQPPPVAAKKSVEKQPAQMPSSNASGPQVLFANSSPPASTNVLSGGPVAATISDVQKAAEPLPVAKTSADAPSPQPEVLTSDNAFSTFSLNVSDVSFKLAAASLEKGAMPEVASLRSEEFLNAFDYRDPMPAAGVPVAFAWERARYPFAHNRDALRFSVKTAAQGREGGKPLNIVLLLDNSGSMERADRVRTIQESLRSLAAQLQPQDKLSVVTFARTPRLWADGVPGAQAAEVAKQIGALTPEGGTNLEDALDLAYRTALRHYAATAVNRVVLLTDGAANLGNVEPKTLKAKVEGFRQQGVALDCFGIGWDGFNDDLLEQLSRNGDGRYGFVNTPEEAATEFVGQLAGALRVAASDVKVQVEFNPKRVTAYRQIGYAKHQLTKQQFRDNTVDAAEIGAAEAGNGLYIIETNPRGEGPIATVRARFRIPQTSDYREHEWVVPFGSAVDLEQSGSAMRLATSASAFSEWLAGSPFAGEVTTDRLLGILSGVPEVYGADPRPKKLEWMIRQAKSISGK